MKKETKEETGGGIFVASFFIMFIALALFLWSPMKFYLGKWSNYWQGKNIEGKFENKYDCAYILNEEIIGTSTIIIGDCPKKDSFSLLKRVEKIR